MWSSADERRRKPRPPLGVIDAGPCPTVVWTHHHTFRFVDGKIAEHGRTEMTSGFCVRCRVTSELPLIWVARMGRSAGRTDGAARTPLS